MDNKILLYSTVRINTILDDNLSCTGTGFYYIFEIEDKKIPVIITNKHVIKGGKKGKFKLCLPENSDERFVDVELDNFEKQWIMHPQPDVDLCILPINPLIEDLYRSGKRVLFKAISKNLIPSNEVQECLTAVEDILMIGYPNGIWDSYNNKPIVRRGITATDITLDYNNKAEFLIDIAAFPGSSGSPVFIYNQGTYPIKDGIAMGDRLLFVGILYAGTMMNIQGEIETIEIPTINKSIAISRIPNNIGIVIKASKILDFEKILKKMI